MTEKEPQESQNKEYTLEILRGLPLETCTLETDPITGLKGWHAPPEKAFKVTGQFIIQPEGSLKPMWEEIESKESHIAKNPKQYAYYLAEYGDDEEAFEELLDDLYDHTMIPYVTEFIGQWLIIPPSEEKTENKIRYPQKSYKPAEIHIRTDRKVYSHNDFSLAIKDLNPESDKKIGVLVSVEGQGRYTVVEYEQLCAIVNSKCCQIELVASNPEKNIITGDIYKNNNQVITPGEFNWEETPRNHIIELSPQNDDIEF